MYGFSLPMRMKKVGVPGTLIGLGLRESVVDRLCDLVALGVDEQSVDVEPRNLAGQLPDQVVGHPARVLGALISVERLLQVPEPVLEPGGKHEALRLHRVVADEREAAELGVRASGTHVVLDDVGKTASA